MNGDAPLGSFEEQVLLAVIRTNGESYGMSIRREIENAAERDVAIGAVYATLDRLEAKKLVRSFRETTPDGRERRMFETTRAGLHALAESKAMRERLWRGINVLKLLEEF
jgi:PadR family transcriptional regulator, regulatory protein PadR